MSLIRDIGRMQHEAGAKVLAALADMRDAEIPYFINETLRTKETQACYYLQGRCPLVVVNHFRKEAGLYELTEAENKRIITNTLKSKHIDGLAIDIVPLKDGAPWWAAPDTEYKKIADVMKKHGFKWGGDWTNFVDSPHYEV